MQCKLTVIRLVSMMRFESKATCLANHVGFISCHITPLVIYAPINNMPHYSPPGLCRGVGHLTLILHQNLPYTWGI